MSQYARYNLFIPSAVEFGFARLDTFNTSQNINNTTSTTILYLSIHHYVGSEE